jgi:hypothetical protein
VSYFLTCQTFEAAQNFTQRAVETYPASQYKEFLEVGIAKWRFQLQGEVHDARLDHVRHVYSGGTAMPAIQ